MTEHEQRVAIAEWMGWRFPEPESGMCLHPDGGRVPAKLVPDYTRDLNAMHEAEMRLTPAQEEDYVHRLGQALMTRAYDDDPRWEQSNLSSFDSTYRATAAQRSEALLHTLNLWRDKPPKP